MRASSLTVTLDPLDVLEVALAHVDDEVILVLRDPPTGQLAIPGVPEGPRSWAVTLAPGHCPPTCRG